MNDGLLILLGVILGVTGLALLGRHIMKKRREAAAKVAAAEQRARRQEDPLKQDAPVAGDPLTIKVGDLLDYLGDGNTYAVRGTITCTEGNYAWKEHLIDTGTGTKRWLSVEEDEGDVTVIAWTAVSMSEVQVHGKRLRYGGIEYELEEDGVANYRCDGTTGLPPSGSVEYADYEASDGRYFARERFDQGSWEAAVGETVHAGFLTIYPGSDR